MRPRVVYAPVIHDDEFEIRPGLVANALDGCGDGVFGIVGRHQRAGFTSPQRGWGGACAVMLSIVNGADRFFIQSAPTKPQQKACSTSSTSSFAANGVRPAPAAATFAAQKQSSGTSPNRLIACSTVERHYPHDRA